MVNGEKKRMMFLFGGEVISNEKEMVIQHKLENGFKIVLLLMERIECIRKGIGKIVKK